MYVTGVSEAELERALDRTNLDFTGNVRFKSLERLSSNRIRFTLTVNDSRGPGSKYNPRNGRRIAAACWHVHGRYFDHLLDINPSAVIKSGWHGSQTITRDSGNWQDVQAGPPIHPHMASEECHCAEHAITDYWHWGRIPTTERIEWDLASC